MINYEDSTVGKSHVIWEYLVQALREFLKMILELKSYRKKVQAKLSEDQKAKRLKFANWIRTNFRKEDNCRFWFSDEKLFDINGVYNSQNERVWPPRKYWSWCKKVAPRKYRNLLKMFWSDLEYVPKEYPSFADFRRGNCWSSAVYIYMKCSLRLSNSETTCLGTIGRFSKMKEANIFTKKLKIMMSNSFSIFDWQRSLAFK